MNQASSHLARLHCHLTYMLEEQHKTKVLGHHKPSLELYRRGWTPETFSKQILSFGVLMVVVVEVAEINWQ